MIVSYFMMVGEEPGRYPNHARPTFSTNRFQSKNIAVPYSMQIWRGSIDSVPVFGSRKPEPRPRMVTIAPVSLVMYRRLAPFGPITLPRTLKLGGAFSKPIKTFSWRNRLILASDSTLFRERKLGEKIHDSQVCIGGYIIDLSQNRISQIGSAYSSAVRYNVQTVSCLPWTLGYSLLIMWGARAEIKIKKYGKFASKPNDHGRIKLKLLIEG